MASTSPWSKWGEGPMMNALTMRAAIKKHPQPPADVRIRLSESEIANLARARRLQLWQMKHCAESSGWIVIVHSSPSICVCSMRPSQNQTSLPRRLDPQRRQVPIVSLNIIGAH